MLSKIGTGEAVSEVSEEIEVNAIVLNLAEVHANSQEFDFPFLGASSLYGMNFFKDHLPELQIAFNLAETNFAYHLRSPYSEF